MSTGILMSIIGISLSLYFGINALNSRKKQISLLFRRMQCYSIYKNEIDDLNIEIKYKGEAIKNHLIFYKGTISNDGKSDIDKKIISQPLGMSIGDNQKWLEAKVINKPSGSEVLCEISKDNRLLFDWDLLKVGEEIGFEAIIEIPKDEMIKYLDDKMYNSIKFDSRISNLRKINKVLDSSYQQYRMKNIKLFSMSLGIPVLIVGILLVIGNFTKGYHLPNSKMQYTVISQEDTLDTYITQGINEKLILVTDGKRKEIEIEEFNDKYVISEIKIIKSLKTTIIYLIGGVAYILIFFVFLGIYKKANRKMKIE